MYADRVCCGGPAHMVWLWSIIAALTCYCSLGDVPGDQPSFLFFLVGRGFVPGAAHPKQARFHQPNPQLSFSEFTILASPPTRAFKAYNPCRAPKPGTHDYF